MTQFNLAPVDYLILGIYFVFVIGIGLRDEYHISGPELETMCDIAYPVLLMEQNLR